MNENSTQTVVNRLAKVNLELRRIQEAKLTRSSVEKLIKTVR